MTAKNKASKKQQPGKPQRVPQPVKVSTTKTKRTTRQPTKDAFGIGWKNGALSGYWAPTMNGFEDLMSPPAQLSASLRESMHNRVSHEPKPDLKAEPFDEFVANITVSGTPTDLQVNHLFLNPGIAETFPLLNKILNQYERYAFDWLEFYIMPLDSSYGQPSGKFYMCADLGSTLSFPSTVEDIQNNSIHVSGKVSKNLAIELAGVTRHSMSWFVRDRYLAAGADIRKFDLGKFFYGYYGLPATATGIIGELHVRGVCNGYDRYQKTGIMDPVFGSTLVSNLDVATQSFTTTVPVNLNWRGGTSIPTESSLAGQELPGTAIVVSPGASGLLVKRSGLYQLSGTIILATSAANLAVVAQSMLRVNGLDFANIGESVNLAGYICAPFNRAVYLNENDAITVSVTAFFASGTVTTASGATSSTLCITALG